MILERSRLRICYTFRREVLLFYHMLTKSPCDGTSNLFSLKHDRGEPSLCPVTALEVYMAVTKSISVPLEGGYLFRPVRPSRKVPWHL